MKRLPALSAAAMSLPVYAFLVTRFNFVSDDAFISFRYARHLARGLGLRYNLGVDPPVEGYSNFLWVLAMAVVERIGGDPAVGSRILSVLCGVALIVHVTGFVSRRISDAAPVPITAAMLLATFPAVTVWSTGGLATVPFALLIFSGFERLLGDPDRPRGLEAGILMLLAALLRADGAYWGVLILALAGLTLVLDVRDVRERRTALLRATVMAGSVLLLGIVLYVSWRHAYHGDWLPNTARVKVGLSAFTLGRGLDYVISFLLGVTSTAVILALSPWALSGRGRALAGQCLFMIAGTFAYTVLVGGDFMAMGRLLLPAMPFLAVLGALIVERVAAGGTNVAEGRHRAAWLVLAALVVLSVLPAFNLHPVPGALRRAFHFRWNLPGYATEYDRYRAMRGNAARWTLLGRALGQHTRPGESIVTDAIGAVGYYSELFVFDQYGLTDREAVHREIPPGRRSAGHDRLVEPEYFLPDEPTYLGAHLEFGARTAGDGADPVPAGYRVESIPLPDEGGYPPDTVLKLIRRID